MGAFSIKWNMHVWTEASCAKGRRTSGNAMQSCTFNLCLHFGMFRIFCILLQSLGLSSLLANFHSHINPGKLFLHQFFHPHQCRQCQLSQHHWFWAALAMDKLLCCMFEELGTWFSVGMGYFTWSQGLQRLQLLLLNLHPLQLQLRSLYALGMFWLLYMFLFRRTV